MLVCFWIVVEYMFVDFFGVEVDEIEVIVV